MRKKNYNTLTKREKEVLALLSEGHSIAEISKKLNLSVHTITDHKERITIKLNLRIIARKPKAQQSETAYPKQTKQIEISSEQVFREDLSYQEHLDNYCYNLLLQGLRACNNSVPALSKKLDLPERTLYRFIKKFGLRVVFPKEK